MPWYEYPSEYPPRRLRRDRFAREPFSLYFFEELALLIGGVMERLDELRAGFDSTGVNAGYCRTSLISH
jgi:hypothetical protein